MTYQQLPFGTVLDIFFSVIADGGLYVGFEISAKEVFFQRPPSAHETLVDEFQPSIVDTVSTKAYALP